MKSAPREWTKYQYFDPDIVLPRLQNVRKMLSESDAPEKIKNLRTNGLRDHREHWDTAVFCKLMGLSTGRKILLSTEEESDFDAVFTWGENDSQSFAPVQMKELVPYESNPCATLQRIINGLKKYADSKNLVVAIKLNRTEQIVFDELDLSGVGVAEIWCFGATKQDESGWCLIGDLLGSCKHYRIEWPYA